MGGRDFPSLDILNLWGKYEPDSSLPGMFYRNIRKHFSVIGTQKVPREILVVVTIPQSITFSPQRARKARDEGKTVPFVLDHTWHGDLTRRSSFFMPCPFHPEFSLWAMLTLVCQGHSLKNPGSLR